MHLKLLGQSLGKKVGVDTVRRAIKSSGLRYLVVEEERKLTKPQSRAKYNWDLVLFSDEKTFQIGGGKKKQWQNPKKRVKREVETHPKQVHVWAGIGAYFKTPLVIFEHNMNSEYYKKVLCSNLPPKICAKDLAKGKEDDWIFVQDNARLGKS